MKNKKTLSMLALGLLLGGGAIGAMQVSANSATNKVAAVNAIDQSQQVVKSATETVDTTVDKPEAGDTTDSKESVADEKDGIDHRFEGDEGNHQD